MKAIERVEQVESSSSKAVYTVTLFSDQSWFCTCPAFRFQYKPAEGRVCKHVAAVMGVAKQEAAAAKSVAQVLSLKSEVL